MGARDLMSGPVYCPAAVSSVSGERGGHSYHKCFAGYGFWAAERLDEVELGYRLCRPAWERVTRPRARV